MISFGAFRELPVPITEFQRHLRNFASVRTQPSNWLAQKDTSHTPQAITARLAGQSQPAAA